jgi:hypothetical protein
MTTTNPRHQRYVLEMVTAIIERGDDQLRDGAIGSGPHSDARWVIDLLLGQLGYELHVDEDGNVSLWSKDDDTEELIMPDHYRVSQDENGAWLHRDVTGYRADKGVVTPWSS